MNQSWIVHRLSLFSLLVLLAAPLSAEPVGPTAVSVAGWRADLDQLVQAIEELHFRPFHRISKSDFDAAVATLRLEIPRRSDQQILLGMTEIVSSLADGHTRLALPRQLPQLATELHAGHGGIEPPEVADLALAHLPVELELFDDGLFVVRTTRDLRHLVGAEVVTVGDTPAEEAVIASHRLAPADNEMTARWLAPDRLEMPAVLSYLGLVDDTQRIPMTFELRPIADADDGSARRIVETLELEPADEAAPWTEPLAIPGAVARPQGASEHRWARMLSNHDALYVRIDTLEQFPDELPADWLGGLVAEAEAAGHDRLVLDLRRNFGGSGSWNDAFVQVMARSPFNHYGKLFVLIGRRTFSAAQQLVEDLEVRTQAIFVGEPTGSRPGHFGDPEIIRLAHSGLTLRVSKYFWSPHFAGDFRTSIAPHQPVAMTAEQALAGKDPVLDAALSYQPPAGLVAQVEDLLRRGKLQEGIVHFFRSLADPRLDHDVMADVVTAGHRLLDEDLIQEGYFLFVLARDFYPIDARAHAGLGRAMELRGEEDSARRRYRRALELDPRQEAARRALKRLGAESS